MKDLETILIYGLEKSMMFFEQSAEKLGIPFLLGGFVGALVNRMRKRMTWIKFICSIFLAMFVGWVVGISLRSFFDFDETFLYAICSMAGAFSEDLLDEVEKLIDNISEIIKSRLRNKDHSNES